MKLWNEFKEFAMKGSMVDLAVGVIIGGAFGKIVSSLVDDVLMPPLGWLMGGLDFKDKKILIQQAGSTHPITGKIMPKDVVISYGNFINVALQFFIMAMAIFVMIKLINNMRRKPPPPDAAPPAPTPEEKLLAEIRDILKTRPA